LSTKCGDYLIRVVGSVAVVKQFTPIPRAPTKANSGTPEGILDFKTAKTFKIPWTILSLLS